MAWDFSPHAPVYYQIAERIRKSILAGEFSPGDQIPSVRQYATEATVNPNTVQRALSDLESTGLIESRGTLGRFVTEENSIIEKCRENEAKKLIGEFLGEAYRLRIPKPDLICMIEADGSEQITQKEADTNECT